MAVENTAWQLADLVESLVVELDKTRETLAVKSINKRLMYSVKEVALDLNIFPAYDGDQVKFLTAQPGQEGASKVSIQLDSITDQQVRATTKMPGTKGDIKIDEIDVDKTTKKELRKLGVSSIDDLNQIERKNVDIKKVSDNAIDYSKLANQIQKSRRGQIPPKVNGVSMSVDESKRPYLSIQGENLAVDPKFQPVAVINEALAEVMSSTDRELRLRIAPEHKFSDHNEVILTFDPFAVMKVNVTAPQKTS